MNYLVLTIGILFAHSVAFASQNTPPLSPASHPAKAQTIVRNNLTDPQILALVLLGVKKKGDSFTLTANENDIALLLPEQEISIEGQPAELQVCALVQRTIETGYYTHYPTCTLTKRSAPITVPVIETTLALTHSSVAFTEASLNKTQ